MKSIKFVISCLLLSGCASHQLKLGNLFNQKNIEIGSSLNQVLEDFGPPVRTRKTGNGAEIYYFDNKWCLVKDNKVIDADKLASSYYVISIKSVTDREIKKTFKTFDIYSGNEKVSNDDLTFKDYASALQSILEAEGYKRVKKNPDVFILLNFGISDPIVDERLVSTPVYNWIPGNTTTAYAGSYGNSAYVTQSSPGYVQYAGQNTYTYKTVSFRRHMLTVFYDGASVKDPKIITKIYSESIGATDDLKPVAGIMLSFVPEYMMTSTARTEQHQVATNSPAASVFYEH